MFRRNSISVAMVLALFVSTQCGSPDSVQPRDDGSTTTVGFTNVIFEPEVVHVGEQATMRLLGGSSRVKDQPMLFAQDAEEFIGAWTSGSPSGFERRSDGQIGWLTVALEPGIRTDDQARDLIVPEGLKPGTYLACARFVEGAEDTYGPSIVAVDPHDFPTAEQQASLCARFAVVE